MNTKEVLAPIATSIILSLLVANVAEARLVRGGGSGSAVAPAIGGSDTYLLPAGVYTSVGVDVVPASALLGLPSYSYSTGTGDPIQAHHNWGAACSENQQIPGAPLGELYDCFFLLGSDEVFDWSGHIIGLPLLTSANANAPSPELRYSWLLQAGTESFTFDQDSPNAPLGVATSRPVADPDGFDETCFSRFIRYDAGGCQLLDLNSGLTGSQLLDAAMGGDIYLELSVELLAPDGFEFVNIWGYADPDPALRGELASSPTSTLATQSRRLPIQIDVVEVPVPAPLFLILGGFAFLRIRRLKQPLD